LSQTRVSGWILEIKEPARHNTIRIRIIQSLFLRIGDISLKEQVFGRRGGGFPLISINQ